MKLATTTGDFNSYTGSQIESLRLIREAGFSYADYSFGHDHAMRCGVYLDDYKGYFQEIQNATDEIGIRLVQAHSPLGTPLHDPDGQFLADTIRCVEACGHWGIPNLVVHSGYLRGLDRQATFEANKAFFLPILESAERYNVSILVENFNRMHVEGLWWIDNATDLLALIEHIDHPLLHAVWDVGHANLQAMPQDTEMKILGHHIRAVHIQDNCGDSDTHLLPFFGTMNLDAVMHGLQEICYDGYFTFEVGSIFRSHQERRPYPKDDRLLRAPLSLKLAAEKYLYELGRCVLETYDCFEA